MIRLKNNRNIWLISDTHFQHNNIVSKFDPPRPFNNIWEHDETLIYNWNKVVNHGDKVYHLGDVFFGNKDSFKRLWPRLNGSKRLIVGNHDDVKFLSSGGFFQKVMLWKVFSEFGLLLSHVPVHESSFRGRTELNVHGHTHFRGSAKGPYKSVCCELIDYTPINIEELRIN